jgi:hypothetical protein
MEVQAPCQRRKAAFKKIHLLFLLEFFVSGFSIAAETNYGALI